MNKIEVLEVCFEFNNQRDCLYPVILEDEKEMILIDCGYPGFLDNIEKAAAGKGIDIAKLTGIVITHHDFDHMGSLADFKRKYPRINVIASVDDEPYISGRKKSLRLQQAESIYDSLPEEEKSSAREFHRSLEAVESCSVDITLKDGDTLNYCGGIEVIATPGHMPGHISLYHRESRSVIAGDALVIDNGKLSIAMPQYTLDMVSAEKSAKKLLAYDADRIICYHGGVYNNPSAAGPKLI